MSCRWKERKYVVSSFQQSSVINKYVCRCNCRYIGKTSDCWTESNIMYVNQSDSKWRTKDKYLFKIAGFLLSQIWLGNWTAFTWKSRLCRHLLRQAIYSVWLSLDRLPSSEPLKLLSSKTNNPHFATKKNWFTHCNWSSNDWISDNGETQLFDSLADYK